MLIMRTNIDIDNQLLMDAMRAGPFQSKKEAVEAGLRLLARQAAYREVLKWRGKLKWEGEAWNDLVLNESEPRLYGMAQGPVPVSSVVAPPVGDDVVALRKRRLQALIDTDPAGAAGLARRAARTQANISHMALPPYPFGKLAARRLESALKLEPNYFDRPQVSGPSSSGRRSSR
jgi:Arc/MetJ family transcription regulator